MPRTHPEALILDPVQVRARWQLLRERQEIVAIDGTSLNFAARTVCFHGDMPGIVEVLQNLNL